MRSARSQFPWRPVNPVSSGAPAWEKPRSWLQLLDFFLSLFFPPLLLISSVSNLFKNIEREIPQSGEAEFQLKLNPNGFSQEFQSIRAATPVTPPSATPTPQPRPLRLKYPAVIVNNCGVGRAGGGGDMLITDLSPFCRSVDARPRGRRQRRRHQSHLAAASGGPSAAAPSEPRGASPT